MKPHWPKVQQWQRDDSMLLVDMINSLLGNPVERPKYESLLSDNLPVEEIVTSPKSPKSLLADDRLAPRPKEKPFDLLAKEPKAGGPNVSLVAINKVMDILGDTNESIKPLMMHTAFKESDYGNHPDTFNFKSIEEGTVGHGGIFQVTDKAVKNIINDPRPRIKKDLKLLKKQGIDPAKAIEKKELRKFLEVPLNSAAMARMHYKLFNEPLPKKEDVKAYYINRYAPQTKNNQELDI